MGITERGRFHLLWIERHKGLRPDQQRALVISLQARFEADLTVIEDNGYQEVFATEVERGSAFAVHRHTTGSKKHDELVGLPSVRTHLANRRLLYPCAPDQSPSPGASSYSQCTFTDYRDEKGDVTVRVDPAGGPLIYESLLVLFSEMAGWVWRSDKGQWKSVKTHDDTTMAQWFAVLGAKKHISGSVKLIGGMNIDTNEFIVTESYQDFIEQGDLVESGASEFAGFREGPNPKQVALREEAEKKKEKKEKSLFDSLIDQADREYDWMR
jgi:hypothetical protein